MNAPLRAGRATDVSTQRTLSRPTFPRSALVRALSRRLLASCSCAASLWPAIATALTASDLGPIVLTRPLAPSTLERLAHEADSIYRSGNAAQALEAYRVLADLDASRPLAWLRIGNLHHQAGRTAQALEAYARAVPSPGDPLVDADVAGKALFNIAALGFEQAGNAVERLGALPVADGVARALEALLDQVYTRLASEQREWNPSAGAIPAPTSAWTPASTSAASAASLQGNTVGSPAATIAIEPRPTGATPALPMSMPTAPRAPTPAAIGPAQARSQRPFEPYTVDRWTGRSAPTQRTAARARGSVAEPLTLDPVPGRPVVEYIHGAPARPGAR